MKKGAKNIERFLSSKKISLLFYFFLFTFIFSFSFVLPKDPDFGWHLRYGEEVILNKNILTKDTFSHTFFGQEVLDTEWLIESLSFLIFSRWSFIGLAFFGAIVTSLAFLIPVLFISGSLYTKFLITSWSVLGSSLVLRVGPRPQNLSLVFFSLLICSLIKFRKTGKVKFIFFTPFLFLLWANTHPAFRVGLIFFFIFICLEIFSEFALIKKMTSFKQISILLIFFCLSFLLSNIRPQIKEARELNREVFRALILPVNLASEVPKAGKVRETISEWLPPVLIDLPGTLFLLGIIFSIAIYLRKPICLRDLRNIILLLGFIYFSTLSRRNAPFFFLVFMPIMIEKIEEDIPRLKRKHLLLYLGVLIFIVLIVASVIQINKNLREIIKNTTLVSSYCEYMGYPVKAVEFIKKEKPKGNMFNVYNWGGYLIWQLPEYPVFIDGRVPGGKVYSEYGEVISLKDKWQEILKKYNVGWMLVYPNQIFQKIAEVEGNWKTVYEDKKSVVLVKNEK